MTNFNESQFGSNFIDADQYVHLEKFYQQFYAVPTSTILSVPYGFSTQVPPPPISRNLITVPFQNTSQDSMNSDKPSTSSNTPEIYSQAKEDLSDDDMSDVEEDLEGINPYFGIVNSTLPVDKPPNWRSLVLFSGRIKPEDLPKNCPKPQQDDGVLLPMARKLILNSVNSNGTLRKCNAKHTMQYPGGVQTFAESRTENYGYVSANGRTWFRKKPADSPSTAPVSTPTTTRKRFANQSLVIAGGKRIYTDNSNECIAYAQSGKCVANNLCAFDHDGKSEHRLQRFCRDQMLGTCRNGSDCPKGLHGLDAHQLPVCQYFLRMICVHDNCPYLHIKHQDSLENCPTFQKGVCLAGLKCTKPHRYSQRVLSAKCNQDLAARSNVPSECSSVLANKSPKPQEDCNDELPTWFF